MIACEIICLKHKDGSRFACYWVHKCCCTVPAILLFAIYLAWLHFHLYHLFFFFPKVTCVEEQVLLDPRSNPLFTPVPVMEGFTPLVDCVLSFSQFTGAERDSLAYLAGLLGARYVSCYCSFLFLGSQCDEILHAFHLFFYRTKKSWCKALSGSVNLRCWSYEALICSSLFPSPLEKFSLFSQRLISVRIPSVSYFSYLLTKRTVFQILGLLNCFLESRSRLLFLFFSNIWSSLITSAPFPRMVNYLLAVHQELWEALTKPRSVWEWQKCIFS